MTRQEIQERVMKVATEVFNLKPKEISLTDHFVHNLGADWSKVEEFVLKLEIAFDVYLMYEDTGDIISVQTAVKHLLGAFDTTGDFDTSE